MDTPSTEVTLWHTSSVAARVLGCLRVAEAVSGLMQWPESAVGVCLEHTYRVLLAMLAIPTVHFGL